MEQAKPSFGLTLTIELYSVVFTDSNCTVSVLPKEGFAGLVSTKAPSGMTMTIILRPVLRHAVEINS